MNVGPRRIDSWLRGPVLARLSRATGGGLTLRDEWGEESLARAEAEGDPCGSINVRDPRFYRHVARGGSLGAAEAYLRGYWDSPDLVATMRVLARSEQAIAAVDRGAARLAEPLRRAAHWLRRNTRRGSRRNIADHYDLSNEFFALWLDPTMTYSCGLFPSQDATLAEASEAKYERICRELAVESGDRLVEIGGGWGGFAEHAARTRGCRVTTTTISRSQHEYAARRFAERGLEDRVELLLRDYRDLSGGFDKLVSIEMIEAVGERYLPEYFRKCAGLLRDGGSMLLQAITIPDERYDRYRKSVDFIQRYIFPGGFLPSPGAIEQITSSETPLRVVEVFDMTPHYARTLRAWRAEFWRQVDRVRGLGFDERFLRTWDYYLAYCEAAFEERRVGVSQTRLVKAA